MARRLVEDHDRRVLEEHASDRQPLLLATGKAIAPFADDRVVFLGESVDHVVDSSCLGGVDELLVGRVGIGVPEVRSDGVVEHVRVLIDHTDGFAEALLGDRTDVGAVDADSSRRHFVETGHERGQRRFAGPDGPTMAMS